MTRENLNLEAVRNHCDDLVNPKLVTACTQIVDYIVHQDQLEFLTTSEVQNLLRGGIDEREALEILYFLTSPVLELLELNFELLEDEHTDDDGYESGPTISLEQLTEAYRNGALVHPNSGALIENFKDVLVPYFSAGQNLNEVRNAAL